MGCDIHIVVERCLRPDGRWTGLYTSDVSSPHECLVSPSERNYAFFGELAGVRGTSERGKEPRGMPTDASELALLQFGLAPGAFHSPSHMLLSEFIDCWRLLEDERASAIPEGQLASALLGVEDDGRLEHRVVFWFDS